MRKARHFVIALLAVTLGGCASASRIAMAPQGAQGPGRDTYGQRSPTQDASEQQSLDSLAYGQALPPEPAAAPQKPQSFLGFVAEKLQSRRVATQPMPQSADPTAYGADLPPPPAPQPIDTVQYGPAVPMVQPVPVAVPAPAPALFIPTEELLPPEAVEAAFAGDPPYTLDSGDRLRIVVFGQDGLSNSYTVDASGAITMPLVRSVKARGLTTHELARAIAERLRNGYVREPHVAIEVEIYRPFFILGEVIIPGQYAYVPHMTVENAIAIAGGFTPRAYRWDIRIDRPVLGGIARKSVPPTTRVRPGDTVYVTERWF
jgi:polysaccharide export outer membrane protein